MALPSEIHPFHLAGAGQGYQVANSLRFRGSNSAYLTRTPSYSTNRTTWTWSGWVKRGTLGALVSFWGTYVGSNNLSGIDFTSSDTIEIFQYNGSYIFQLTTTQVFRDPSAWYHIVVAFDTTQATASNRIKLYVNGSQVTTFGTASYPTQNYVAYWNNNIVHDISRRNSTAFFDGYQAEVNFIDGVALDPTYFGQTDTVTGAWIPKKAIGWTNYQMINSSLGTNIGTMLSNGGLAAAFDGTIAQAYGSDAGVAVTGNGVAYVGKDWGSGVTQSIGKIDVYGVTNYSGFTTSTATPTMKITLQGSTDNFSSSVVNLGDSGNFTPAAYKKVTVTATDTTAYRYHRAKIEEVSGADAGGHAIDCAELQFYAVPLSGSSNYYGTNGFYLPFSDVTSTTTLGYDQRQGSYSQNLRSDGTNIGNMTDASGLAAAFDGVVNSQTLCAQKTNGTDNTATPKVGGYVGKDWGAGVTKTIKGFVFKSPSNEYVNNLTTGSTITVTLQGSTDNFSSSIVDLGSGSFTDVSTGYILTVTNVTTTTAYRYHRIKIESSGTFSGGGCRCAELELYAEGTYTFIPNNWTPSGISVTSGVTYDVMRDSPTNYNDGSTIYNRGNYCTLNPVKLASTSYSSTFSYGNLRWTGSSSAAFGTFRIPTAGKWYFEYTLTTAVYPEWGIARLTAIGQGGYAGIYGLYTTLVMYDTTYTSVSGGVLDTSGDIGMVCVDSDNNKVWLGRYRSGVLSWAGNGSPYTPTSPTFSGAAGGGVYSTAFNIADEYYPFVSNGNGGDVWDVNFGQRAWINTPPTGYLSLNTYNLANPSLPLV